MPVTPAALFLLEQRTYDCVCVCQCVPMYLIDRGTQSVIPLPYSYSLSSLPADLNAADLALYAEANERLTAALAAANAAD